WIAQLSDKDANMRYKAAQALGSLDLRDADAHREKVLAALGKALRDDKDNTMRFVAARALRCYGQHAVPVFLEALKDKDADVRVRAARELGEISEWQYGGGSCGMSTVDRRAFPVRPESILPALCEAVRQDKEPTVRWAAAWSLANFGKPAVPALEEALLKDKDTTVREGAVRALKRI